MWWVKGFYKSEDDALYAAIKKYERKSGVKVELSQYAVQDMNAKSVAALDAGTVPDIAYSDTYDVQTAGKWAFDGKLEDLSDVLAPMKDRFEAVALSTAFLVFIAVWPTYSATRPPRSVSTRWPFFRMPRARNILAKSRATVVLPGPGLP